MENTYMLGIRMFPTNFFKNKKRMDLHTTKRIYFCQGILFLMIKVGYFIEYPHRCKKKIMNIHNIYNKLIWILDFLSASVLKEQKIKI